MSPQYSFHLLPLFRNLELRPAAPSRALPHRTQPSPAKPSLPSAFLPPPQPSRPCPSLPPPFAAMPRQNLSFIDDRLPINYSERPKWSALLRAIVSNSLLHSSLIQELMHKILWQYLVVNHE